MSDGGGLEGRGGAGGREQWFVGWGSHPGEGDVGLAEHPGAAPAAGVCCLPEWVAWVGAVLGFKIVLTCKCQLSVF